MPFGFQGYISNLISILGPPFLGARKAKNNLCLKVLTWIPIPLFIEEMKATFDPAGKLIIFILTNHCIQIP